MPKRLQEAVIDDALGRGIYPDARVPVDAGWLQTCQGVRPTSQNRLIAHEVPTWPETLSHTQTNFTQFLEGASIKLADWDGSELELFDVIPSGWTLGSDKFTDGQMVSVADDSTLVNAIKNTNANHWHHAEGADIWLMTNGRSYVTNCGIYAAEACGVASTAVIPGSACIFDGRLVLGGLYSSAGGIFDASTTWGKVMEAWRNFGQSFLSLTSDDNMLEVDTENPYVLIGAPGGGAGDIPFLLENVLLSGYLDRDWGGAVVEAFESGEMTLLKLPWRGAIKAVKQLGARLAVYGEEGVGLIIPLDGGGYAFRQVSSVGIPYPGAVVGDYRQHVFVDNNNKVWSFSGEYALRSYDFQDIVSTVTGAETHMSENHMDGDIYISSTAATCCLSSLISDEAPMFGLSRSNHYITSTVSGDELVATWPNEVANPTFSFRTANMTMGERGMKMVRGVELEHRHGIDATIQLYYRSGNDPTDDDDAYSSLAAIPINNIGQAFPAAMGTDFSVAVAGTVAAGLTIDRVIMRFVRMDGRYE